MSIKDCSLCSIFNCSSKNQTVKDNCILEHVEALTDIEKASIEYSSKNPSERTNGLYDKSELEWAFEEGCKWQKQQLIEKACNWLKEDSYFYVNDYTGNLYEDVLIETFKKAMEE